MLTLAVMVLLMWTVACDRKGNPADVTQVSAVDLLKTFRDAEKRPEGGAFAVQEHTLGAQSRASLIVPANSRMMWTTYLPHRATLELHAAVPESQGPATVEFRVGISDDRIYNTLVQTNVPSAGTASKGWTPITADLSFYAGRKVSLFYRPDEQRWRLIIGTRVISGSPAVVYIGEPAVRTDNRGAREYVKRVARASR